MHTIFKINVMVFVVLSQVVLTGVSAETPAQTPAGLKRIMPRLKSSSGTCVWAGRWMPVADIEGSIKAVAANPRNQSPYMPTLVMPDPSLGYSPNTLVGDGPRSYCLVRFTGPRVRVIGGRGPDHGQMEVFIDDALLETVDTYAPQAQAGQVLFDRDGLDPKQEHQIRLVI
jgi:hypothetical protein